MKKVSIIGFVVIMAMLLAACSAGGGGTAPTPAQELEGLASPGRKPPAVEPQAPPHQ